MKVAVGILLLHVNLHQACLEKVPTVHIQNYEGPIYVSTPHKHTCDHCPLLHHKKTYESDCNCITTIHKPCEFYDVPKVCGSNYYEAKTCNLPYDVPKTCDSACYELPKVCTVPIYETPKVCTTNYYVDSKYDIPNYNQYYQQQNCFSKDCQRLGLLSEAKVKVLQVIPEGVCSVEPRTLYRCDGDGLYNYGCQGCVKSCKCKKCGGYRIL